MHELIAVSGKYYPNKMGRIYLAALEEAVGRNGLSALLNRTGLVQYIEKRPSDNWEREFDFAHISNLNQGLYEMYGPRGGRHLAIRSGGYFFDRGVKQLGMISGLGDIALRILPLHTKLKMGLVALARIFSQFSDQHSRVDESDNQLMYFVDTCPICWGQTLVLSAAKVAPQPMCHFNNGLLQAALGWSSGGLNFRIEQVQGKAVGDETCAFKIDKEPIK